MARRHIHVLLLVHLMFVLSVHTADVERGFSKVKLVKTLVRNSLTATCLDALMRVQCHLGVEEIGKEDSDIVMEAIKLWEVDGGGHGTVQTMLRPMARALHEAVAKFHTEEEQAEIATAFGLDVQDGNEADEIIDVDDDKPLWDDEAGLANEDFALAGLAGLANEDFGLANEDFA